MRFLTKSGERYDLEQACEEVSMFIEGLDDIEQKICELRYKEKCSYEAIGNVICTDRTTARRKLLIIHDKLAEELGLIA